MAWYAYCITEQQTLANGTRSRRPSLLEGVQGVNGATVLAYPSGEFNIVVSEYARDDAQFGEKNVLEHARVVSMCFRSGTVLPFRFGTIFDSDEALRRNRRIGYFIAAVVGLALPGPDPVTTALEVLPMWALFEGSIWLAWFTERRRQTAPSDAFQAAP